MSQYLEKKHNKTADKLNKYWFILLQLLKYDLLFSYLFINFQRMLSYLMIFI
jgi:hypothetical protein